MCQISIRFLSIGWIIGLTLHERCFGGAGLPFPFEYPKPALDMSHSPWWARARKMSIGSASASPPRLSLLQACRTTGVSEYTCCFANSWIGGTIDKNADTLLGPAAVVRTFNPANEADVVVEAPNHQPWYYHRTPPDSNWYAYQMPVTVLSAPAIAVRPDGQAHVAYTDSTWDTWDCQAYPGYGWDCYMVVNPPQ